MDGVIYLDMPKLRCWEVDMSGNCQITDEQLCTFLENINARGNTRVLSIVGWANMKGTGLDPLHVSTVMENINLCVLGSLALLGELGKVSVPIDNLDFLIVRNEYYCPGCASPYWGEIIL